MSTEFQSAVEAAMRLCEKDRITLIRQLIDTVPDSEFEDEFDEAFFDELDRRVAEGMEATVDWESVRNEPI